MGHVMVADDLQAALAAANLNGHRHRFRHPRRRPARARADDLRRQRRTTDVGAIDWHSGAESKLRNGRLAEGRGAPRRLAITLWKGSRRAARTGARVGFEAARGATRRGRAPGLRTGARRSPRSNSNVALGRRGRANTARRLARNRGAVAPAATPGWKNWRCSRRTRARANDSLPRALDERRIEARAAAASDAQLAPGSNRAKPAAESGTGTAPRKSRDGELETQIHQDLEALAAARRNGPSSARTRGWPSRTKPPGAPDEPKSWWRWATIARRNATPVAQQLPLKAKRRVRRGRVGESERTWSIAGSSASARHAISRS